MWYATGPYLVNFTDLETSWGSVNTVTYWPLLIYSHHMMCTFLLAKAHMLIKNCVFQSTVDVSALYVEESPLVFDGDKLSCLAIKLLHVCFCES